VLYYATNYKPLAYRGCGSAVELASLEEHLDHHHHDPLIDPWGQRIGPYTYGQFRAGVDGPQAFTHTSHSLFELHPELQVDAKKVPVICSGGLDSCTVAWLYHRQGWEVTLLPLPVAGQGQQSEITAVKRLLRDRLGWSVQRP
jgi:hypothetical protein